MALKTSNKSIAWKTEQRQISELKPAKYNPRVKLSGRRKKALEESLDKFGLSSPIIINADNTIIGGHQRYYIYKERGRKVVDVRVPNRKLTKKEEKEKNLRLNENLGEYDIEKLAVYDIEFLDMVGFSRSDLEKVYRKKDKDMPEVEFSRELLLEHNYIVLYFDNPLDWEVAKEKFGLKRVKDYIPRKGQPVGVGRVIEGKKVLKRIK